MDADATSFSTGPETISPVNSHLVIIGAWIINWIMIAMIPLDVIIFRPEPYPHPAPGVAVSLKWLLATAVSVLLRDGGSNQPFDLYTANIGNLNTGGQSWSSIHLKLLSCGGKWISLSLQRCCRGDGGLQMCLWDHLRVSKIPLLWGAAGALNPEVCRTFQKIRLADRLLCLHGDGQMPGRVTEHRFLSHNRNIRIRAQRWKNRTGINWLNEVYTYSELGV